MPYRDGAQRAIEDYDVERFSRRFIEDHDTGCYLWVGSKSRSGFGVFNLGKSVEARRASLLILGEGIKDSQTVRNICGNKICVNPAHLAAEDPKPSIDLAKLRMHRRIEKAAVRLIESANKFEDKLFPCPMSGCFIWSGCEDGHGYGVTTFDGKRIGTHRLAWILAGNDLRDGDCILHKCDQPLCCNVDHLFVGDRADNNWDRARKSRSKPGKLPYGVGRQKNGRFSSQFSFKGEYFYLGTFDTAEEANAVALAKKKEMYGLA